MRLKKCRTCGDQFAPVRPLQAVCGPLCALKYARMATAKAERKKDKVRAQQLKSVRDLIKEAQTAFNAYIRARDHDLPCVSCGRHHDGQWHAGHYMSTGARPELRFDEANVHKQCAPCNTHLSGNLVPYRMTLIERIGLDEVRRLEGPTTPRKYKRDELEDMKREYNAKTRALKRNTEA